MTPDERKAIAEKELEYHRSWVDKIEERRDTLIRLETSIEDVHGRINALEKEIDSINKLEEEIDNEEE